MPYHYRKIATVQRYPAKNKQLAARLQRLLQKRRWGQLRLAMASGVPLSPVQLLLKGAGNPSLWTAARLAQALGVSLDYLAGLSDDQRLHTGVLLIERDEDAD